MTRLLFAAGYLKGASTKIESGRLAVCVTAATAAMVKSVISVLRDR
ncbi:hypothetical protein [Paenibacillus xerothermodurans]|nr:hypothetical protein [Paenibacillus xerothermodurans]